MDNKDNYSLRGVPVAKTKISHIDGKQGKLIYAGYFLEQLQGRCYEDVLYLLLYNTLPCAQQSQAFTTDLASRRHLSADLEAMIDAIPKNLDYMTALMTGMSALSSDIQTSYPANIEQALDCIAKAPLILGRFYRAKNNLSPLSAKMDLSHVANYYYLLTGKVADNDQDRAYIHALETYFICTLEHGMNNSTFTARVVSSTQTDPVSSVVAALCSLKGPLHGGAPEKVIDMLEAIGTAEHAEAWVLHAIQSKQVVMGFGHAVYEASDPRVDILMTVLKNLPHRDPDYIAFILSVEQTVLSLLKEHKTKKLYTNVEFAAATTLHVIGLPKDIFSATFGLSRLGGWFSHLIEASQSHQQLVRPSSDYIGHAPQVVLAKTKSSPPQSSAALVQMWSKSGEFIEEAIVNFSSLSMNSSDESV